MKLSQLLLKKLSGKLNFEVFEQSEFNEFNKTIIPFTFVGLYKLANAMQLALVFELVDKILYHVHCFAPLEE